MNDIQESYYGERQHNDRKYLLDEISDEIRWYICSIKSHWISYSLDPLEPYSQAESLRGIRIIVCTLTLKTDTNDITGQKIKLKTDTNNITGQKIPLTQNGEKEKNIQIAKVNFKKSTPA